MASLGQKLAEARNRKGISIREASDSTKIRGDFLTKFENDEFGVSLPPVYLRGFLKNYASYLNLDPEGILADFDSQELGDKNRPRKGFGTISVDGQTEEAPLGETPSGSANTSSGSDFPWLKVSVTLASLLVATVFVILIAQLWTGDDDEGDNPIVPEKVVEPGVGAGDATGAQKDPEQGLTLKLIATGPIKLLYVKPELEGQVAQTFRNLEKGDALEISFKGESFTGAASSIENLTFEIDGKQFGFQGAGPLNFRWPAKPLKQD